MAGLTQVRNDNHPRIIAGGVALVLALLSAVIVHGQDAAASADFDPIAYIHGEIEAGRKAISVPCARYWLTPPEDSTCYLALKGLSDVAIDFNGGELIGKVKTSMLDLEGCTNVTLRNVSIDYADLPFTQARIENVGPDGAWDVRVIEGYPRPDAEALQNAGALWPVQAYDANTLELKNPMRFRDGLAIARTGEDTYRITGGENRKGNVGDIAVWSLKEFGRKVSRGAIGVRECKECTFENVTVYSTPHGCGFAEFSASGNRYVNCALVRRPPETDLVKRGMKRVGCEAAKISPEYEWMEGGCSKDIVMRGNTLLDNGDGIKVAGNNGARKRLPAEAHRNIAITGNRISGSVRGITVVGCTGLDVRGNDISLIEHPDARDITLVNVNDVQQ